jgi:hypothetical protein
MLKWCSGRQARCPAISACLDASSRVQFDPLNRRSTTQDRCSDGCTESQVVTNRAMKSRDKGHSESFKYSPKPDFVGCEVFGLLMETNILPPKYKQCSL